MHHSGKGSSVEVVEEPFFDYIDRKFFSSTTSTDEPFVRDMSFVTQT